jgi:hypothetical protein
MMRTILLLAVLCAVSSPALAAPAAAEFFIVSSIDAAHSRLILKRPTDVTVTVRVTAGTRILDEQGKERHLADLRAGDTAWITATKNPAGELTAVLVRLGPMTVEELQRRYLSAG